MGTIEDLLLPDERIVKKQEGIKLENMDGMPNGNLYLTDRRLIFAYSRAMSVFSYPSQLGVFLGKDVVIQLKDIKSVKKSLLGSLKVKADREYDFIVSVVRSQGWVDAVMQGCAQATGSSPTASPLPPPPPPMPPSQACPTCGQQLTYVPQYCRWYCYTCKEYR
jgi:hypothetical protein